MRVIEIVALSVVILTSWPVFHQVQYLHDAQDIDKSRSNVLAPEETKHTEQQFSSLHRLPPVPLPELTRAHEKVVCPAGLLPVPIVSNTTADNNKQADDDRQRRRLIPRIVHQTGEHKCVTQEFYDNMKDWSFEGYSFYFHDAQARQVLFDKFWPEFPHLQNAFHCLENAGGAAVADLWRYLALWEYGGIYTDMDNGPGPLFNGTTITDDMDGYFLQDKGASPGYPTQWFFAVSPKHPLMFLAIYEVLEGMLSLDEVGTFYVPAMTGPSCLDRAFLLFMGVPRSEVRPKHHPRPKAKTSDHPLASPRKGHYVGLFNRSLEIGCNKEDERLYMRSNAISGRKKKDAWVLMNYSHYKLMNKVPQNKTCLQIVMEKHYESLLLDGESSFALLSHKR